MGVIWKSGVILGVILKSGGNLEEWGNLGVILKSGGNLEEWGNLGGYLKEWG